MDKTCGYRTLFQQLDDLVTAREKVTLNDCFENKAFEVLRKVAEDCIQQVQVAEDSYLSHLRAFRSTVTTEGSAALVETYIQDNVLFLQWIERLENLKIKQKKAAVAVESALQAVAMCEASFSAASKDLLESLKSVPTPGVQEKAMHVQHCAAAAAVAADRASQLQTQARVYTDEMLAANESLKAKGASSMAVLQSLETLVDLSVRNNCRTAIALFHDFVRRIDDSFVAIDKVGDSDTCAAAANEMRDIESRQRTEKARVEEEERQERARVEELKKQEACKTQSELEVRQADLICKTALIIYAAESPSETETVKESLMRIIQQMTPVQIEATGALSRLASQMLARKPVVSPKRGDTPVVPADGQCAYCNAEEAGGSQRYQRWSNVIVGDRVFVCCRACYLSTVPAHKGSVAVGPDGKLQIFCHSGKPRSRDQKKAKEHCVGYKEHKIYFSPSEHDDALTDWHQSKQAKKQKYTV